MSAVSVREKPFPPPIDLHYSFTISLEPSLPPSLSRWMERPTGEHWLHAYMALLLCGCGVSVGGVRGGAARRGLYHTSTQVKCGWQSKIDEEARTAWQPHSDPSLSPSPLHPLNCSSWALDRSRTKFNKFAATFCRSQRKHTSVHVYSTDVDLRGVKI